MCQQGMRWKPICSHPMHSATLNSVLKYTRGVPHTCLTSGGSVKHFSNHASLPFLYMAQQGVQWKHIFSHPMHSVTLGSFTKITKKHTRGVPHTCVTQLSIFPTTPTFPVHGSTRHAVETHSLHSAVTLCIL